MQLTIYYALHLTKSLAFGMRGSVGLKSDLNISHVSDVYNYCDFLAGIVP